MLRLAVILVAAAFGAAALAGEAAPPLPDIVQGQPSAPVTIIEYASMTCTHCAAFQANTWPELKRKYVDSGRAKFVLREFPLDPLAAAAFMLGRCAGPQKRDLLLDRLFAQQKSWVVEKPEAPLLAIAETVGLGKHEFEACLRDEKLYGQVSESRERAAKAFGVQATPTFLVNGHKLTGEASLGEFDRAMAPQTR